MVDIVLKLSDIYEKIQNAISKSSTQGLVKNNGDIDTNQYFHTAGTNLTKNGNKIDHSASGVGNATSTTALKSIKYDSQGHITGVNDPPYASVEKAGIVTLGSLSSQAAPGNHAHPYEYISVNDNSVKASHIAPDAVETGKIKNGNVTLTKLNSDVYDTTIGGTNGSSKLITSNAVYNGLIKRLPTTGNGTTTGTITAAGFIKNDGQTGFLKANGTVDSNNYIKTESQAVTNLYLKDQAVTFSKLSPFLIDETPGGTYTATQKIPTSSALNQGLSTKIGRDEVIDHWASPSSIYISKDSSNNTIGSLTIYPFYNKFAGIAGFEIEGDINFKGNKAIRNPMTLSQYGGGHPMTNIKTPLNTRGTVIGWIAMNDAGSYRWGIDSTNVSVSVSSTSTLDIRGTFLYPVRSWEE